MNTILITTFLILGALAAATLAALALVITGIHREERHMNLSARPRTIPEILARRLLNVRVSRPDARRVFAARQRRKGNQTAQLRLRR